MTALLLAQAPRPSRRLRRRIAKRLAALAAVARMIGASRPDGRAPCGPARKH